MLVPLYTLDNRVNKLVRIRRLTPLLSLGKLRFKGGSPGARLLVEKLRDFPNGDHDDGPDALEMATRLAAEMLNVLSQDNLDGLVLVP
jgi:predicted phage terminase large subunit-like protein